MSSPNDSVLFRRSGSQISLISGFIYPPDDQTPVGCVGGQPTVDNTDSVSVLQGPDTDDQNVGFDLRHGPLAPGASPESDGASEIEFDLDMSGDSGVFVVGTDAPDSFSVALLDAMHYAVDFNETGFPEAGEPDLRFGPVLGLSLFGAGGVDVINGAGVPKPSSRALYQSMTLVGGSEHDQLIGGGSSSDLYGGGGRDLLLGSVGSDLLSGGGASDRIVGGRGKDTVETIDGKRDRVQCGASKDRVLADRRDKAKRCEEIRRVGKRKHRFPLLPEPIFPVR